MGDKMHDMGRRVGRRTFLLGTAAAAGTAILAACGGSTATTAPAATTGGGATGATAAATKPAAGTTTGGATTGTTAAATTAPAAQNSGMATTLSWFAARDTTGYSQMQVDAFNKANKSLQLNYQEQGATTQDLHDKFVSVAGAKDAATDIISMDVPYVPEFGAAGWTIPVDDAIPMAERSKFFSGTLTGATYNGALYGVPWFNNGPGLYYRKDLLDAKGFKPPKTYDELLMQATALQTPDTYGFVMQMTQNEGGILNWEEYLWGYGGNLLDDKSTGVVVDMGDAGVKSLQRLVDFVYKDKIMPEATLSLKLGSDAMQLFRTGKAVFLRLWFSSAGDLYKPDATITTQQWDVAPLPSQSGMTAGPGCLGTWNLGVSKFSKKQKESIQAITILTNEENQKARVLGNGNLPARSAVFDDADVQKKFPYAKRAQESFSSLRARGITPFWASLVNDAIAPNFGAAITKQKTADQAIKDMAAKMRDTLKS